MSPINLKFKNSFYNGVEIINPSYLLNPSQTMKPFLLEDDLQSKIYQNGDSEITDDVEDIYPTIFDKFNLHSYASVKNQPEISNKGENYKMAETLKIYENPFYTNSNFEAYRIKFNPLLEANVSIKKEGVEKLANIFFINTCFKFLENTKDDRLLEKTLKFF